MLFALLLLAAAPKTDARLHGTWKLNGAAFYMVLPDKAEPPPPSRVSDSVRPPPAPPSKIPSAPRN